MGGAASVELSAQRIADIFRAANNDRFFELTRGPSDFAYKLLRNGASVDMNVDGDPTPVVFRYTVPAGRTFEFWRMNWHMVDASVRADGFGGLAPLSTGLLLRVLKADESVELDPMDGMTITRHSDMQLLSGTDVTVDISGVGGAEDNVSVRWTITRAGRAMRLTKGQIIEMIVQDDLSGITEFHTMVQGILR